MRSGARRKPKPKGKRPILVEKSSGNVFQDLGLPDSAELFVKSDIAICIASIIEERGLTQVQAAQRMGIDQSDVSDLTRGKLSGFSIDRLFRFLNALGQDVEIRVPKSLHRVGTGSVRVVREERRSKRSASRRRA